MKLDSIEGQIVKEGFFAERMAKGLNYEEVELLLESQSE